MGKFAILCIGVVNFNMIIMVIAYLRVSTGKQHLTNQREEIVKYASRKGLKIERWVTEIVSGKKKEKERKLGKLMGGVDCHRTLPFESDAVGYYVYSESVS